MEGVDNADLGRLPRLPDTATELTSIAEALKLDPAKVLHLGKEANEEKVKSLDLSRYRIIDFATHGLVPGELNGLTQPALALSAPSVTQKEGDGLLTMGEILALKLDADWVECQRATPARRRARGRSRLGTGTRVLLCWNTGNPGDKLVGPFRFGTRAGDRSVPPAVERPGIEPGRSPAAGIHGASRRSGLY